MVNESHILVLKSCNGNFQVSSMPIDDCNYVLTEINNAVENPNKNVLDIQTLFLNKVETKDGYYPYPYPYSYYSSYILGAIKPEFYRHDDYKSMLEDELKGEIEGKSPDLASCLIREANSRIKRRYASTCCRYIKQQMISRAYQNARKDPEVKMYSYESIGWNSFEYKITDDLKVCVNTNFGYGYACYFTLTVSYKNIVIAPFSHVVKYYYANMSDIIKCTRDYIVDRDSWNPALEFVRDFANESLSSPVEFIENYLMNEINEMMGGLRNIVNNPDAVIKMFESQNPSSADYHHLRLISPISDEEKMRFKVYPYEMPVVFKGEKITEAVLMLERLKELAVVYPRINNCINEIRAMAIHLSPEIQETLDGIEIDVAQLTSAKESKVILKNETNMKASVYVDEMKSVIDGFPPNTDWQKIQDFKATYEKDHPSYVTLKNQLCNIEEEISDLNDKISSRKSLLSRLSWCLKHFSCCIEKNVA